MQKNSDLSKSSQKFTFLYIRSRPDPQNCILPAPAVVAGRFAYDPASSEVTTASLFDLASLTKVLATTAMAMILYERGLLDLEAPITAIVPEFASEFADRFADDPRRREVTLRMLLAHTSGLPAYEKLFLRAHSREELLQ